MNTFRLLNQNELQAIHVMQTRGKLPQSHPLLSELSKTLVSYENMQGGFCVCILLVPSLGGYYVYRGASRRSYKDAKNVIRGEMLAFNRALLYSRSTEIQ